jgi:hypothetical protein
MAPTSLVPFTIALIPSAIGVTLLYDLASLTNGVIDGQQPVKSHGRFVFQRGRETMQQRAEPPRPVFLAGYLIRRVV